MPLAFSHSSKCFLDSVLDFCWQVWKASKTSWSVDKMQSASLVTLDPGMSSSGLPAGKSKDMALILEQSMQNLSPDAPLILKVCFMAKPSWTKPPKVKYSMRSMVPTGCGMYKPFLGSQAGPKKIASMILENTWPMLASNWATIVDGSKANMNQASSLWSMVLCWAKEAYMAKTFLFCLAANWFPGTTSSEYSSSCHGFCGLLGFSAWALWKKIGPWALELVGPNQEAQKIDHPNCLHGPFCSDHIGFQQQWSICIHGRQLQSGCFLHISFVFQIRQSFLVHLGQQGL